MRVIDCFTFFNELSLLNMRLHELDDIVDYFVLVESNKTLYEGTDKPFIFNENKEKFDKFKDKIIHVMIDDMDRSGHGGHSWEREHYLRNCITRGLNTIKPEDSDIILISDADEVPRPSKVREIKEQGLGKMGSATFSQKKFFYNFGTFIGNWMGTVAIPYSFYKKRYPQFFRNKRRLTDTKILDGGWHCVFFGTPQMVYDKIWSSPWRTYWESLNHSRREKRGEELPKLVPDLESIKNSMMLREDPFIGPSGKTAVMRNNYERDGSSIDLPKYKGLVYGNV